MIKEHCITTTLTKSQTILLGNERHDLNRTTQFNLFNKNHTFFVIASDFPLIEDGIIGLPFLKQYRCQINNVSLLLDNQELPLQITPVQLELKPGARVTQVQTLGNEVTRIHSFNTGEQNINTNCKNVNKPNSPRVQNLISKLRTDHIEPSYKGSYSKSLVTITISLP